MKMRPLVFILSILVFAAAGSIPAAGQDAAPAAGWKDLTPGEALTLIQENRGNPGFVILDVRTPEEYAEGRLADAVNLDYNDAAFGENLAKLDPAGRYLVYCRSGRRSEGAVTVMAEKGFKDLHNLLGGIGAWLEAGLPVQSR